MKLTARKDFQWGLEQVALTTLVLDQMLLGTSVVQLLVKLRTPLLYILHHLPSMYQLRLGLKSWQGSITFKGRFPHQPSRSGLSTQEVAAMAKISLSLLSDHQLRYVNNPHSLAQTLHQSLYSINGAFVLVGK